jgi:Bacterial Ig domain
MLALRPLRSIGPRLVACGALVGVLAVGATPALAELRACNGELQLTVADPAPGAQLQAGVYNIQGTARDLSATEGAGVKRVQVFLGDRDQGGQFLVNSQVANSNAGWSGNIDLSGLAGTHTLFVYAQSG